MSMRNRDKDKMIETDRETQFVIHTITINKIEISEIIYLDPLFIFILALKIKHELCICGDQLINTMKNPNYWKVQNCQML